MADMRTSPIQGFFPDDLASSETADLFMSVILYRLKKNGRAAVVVPDGFLFGLDNAKVNIKKSSLASLTCTPLSDCPAPCSALYTSITTNLLFLTTDQGGQQKHGSIEWIFRLTESIFQDQADGAKKHFDDCIAWWNNRDNS